MSQVSVVVPIYNAGEKLNKCIKSVLEQSFIDFELILINDGSTDKSLNICKEFEQRDSRVIVIDKRNEGSIATRRKGVENSKSEYILFVDADDWIHNNMIEILYQEAIQSGADITVCNTYKVLGGSTFIKRKSSSEYFKNAKLYHKEEILNKLVIAYFHGHPFPASLCAKLYKKELLLDSGKYLEKIRFLGEDLYYNLEIFLKASIVKIIGDALYYYRFGGFTSKYMPHFFNDMVNGYLIQKEVIDEYYKDSKQIRYNGIAIMLLNTFKTCIANLFNSEFNQSQIKQLIRDYCLNETIRECLVNEGCIRYFSFEYLSAIKDSNVNYLYKMGQEIYQKRRIKKVFINALSKITI